jgi:hypothetical protein
MNPTGDKKQRNPPEIGHGRDLVDQIRNDTFNRRPKKSQLAPVRVSGKLHREYWKMVWFDVESESLWVLG